MKDKIGIIGFGNMGQAIAQQLKANYEVYVFDKDKKKTKALSGVEIARTINDLIDKIDTLILAVKPQDFVTVLREIKGHTENKLIISIAAGIKTGDIEKFLGKTRIVRVMPNICAKIGEAESGLSKGKYALDRDLDFTREIFDCIGRTWIIKEEMIDALTAISGSGPAYIYYDLEVKKIDPLHISEEIKEEYVRRLTEAAEEVGLDNLMAEELASATAVSTISLLTKTAVSPVELRKQITSKGGTTESALKVLAEGGSWKQAAVAAKQRAEELSKKE